MSKKSNETFIVPLESDHSVETCFSPPINPHERGHAQEPMGSSSRPLSATLKRHWILVFCTWLAMAGLGSAWIWKHFKTEYQAVGVVRLAPFIPRLVFQTETNGITPFYGAFLTTQMQLITNQAVLSRAMETPGIKTLPMLSGMDDPAGFLAGQLKVDNPSNTELVSVSLSGRDPRELAPIVNAVLKAYMEKVIEQDQSADLEKLELLYKKQNDLEQELKTRNNELYKLAHEQGALSLDTQQDTVLAAVRELEIEVKKAQAAKVAAQARLIALQQSGPAAVTAFDLAQIKAEMTAQDPELVNLNSSRWLEENRLLQASQQAGQGHREVRLDRGRVAQLDQLIAERQQAMAGSIESFAKYRVQIIHDNEIKKAQQELAEAAQREKALQEVLSDDRSRATQTGRNAIALQEMRNHVDQSKQLYNAVQERITNLEVEKQRPARVTVASWATEPTSPAADRRPKLTILAVAASLFISIMLAVWIDSRDTSVRNEDDIRRNIGLNILGIRSMPRRRQINHEAVLLAITEEIRNIRGCILFASSTQEIKSVLITSPNPREGKTRMAGDLAIALAESGRRVLLIDADNRKRDLSRQFGVEDRAGLSEFLSNGHTPEQVIYPTAIPGLSLLPSGHPIEAFSEWLVRPGRLERVREVFADYDVVLVDSPPVLLSNEVVIGTRQVDASLMVLRASYSAREDAIAAKQKLSQMGGRIIGAVLNGVAPRGVYYQRHGYYSKVG